MTKVGSYNLLAVVAAIALAMATAGRTTASVRVVDAPNASREFLVRTVDLPGGLKGLVDRTGHVVPLASYRRIVSGSSLVDQLLVELSERERIVAITKYGSDHALAPQTSAGLATHPGLSNIEFLLSLKPDLVITNAIGDPAELERLRERHLEVFDLGEMRGLTTLVPNIHAVAALLGHPEAGLAYASRLTRRLARVASPGARRRWGLYVSVYGGQISGAAARTSYHDVLVAAGLQDAAAPRYRDWPSYTVEHLLELDPEIAVTADGMGETLCRQPGLERLRVCRDPRRILTLPGDLIGDPGPGMLEAAELLHERLESFEAAVATTPKYDH